MSFILDALKKLEREKDNREGGVVMVGPVQWGGPDRSRRRGALGLGVAALMLVAAGAIWWLAAPAGEPSAQPDTPATVPPAPVPSTPAPGAAPAEKSTGAEGPRALGAPAPEPTPPAPRALEVPRERTARPPRAPSAAVAPAAEADEEGAEANLDSTLPPVEQGTGLEDAPSAAEDETPTPAPRFRLTVISERDGEPIALLNDRLVREGDRFDDVTVIRIGTSEVEIEVDGERQTIGF